MSKGIFITATGTDVGKTYVSAKLIKKMRDLGYDTGYYKSALSGVDTLSTCDAGIVKKEANLQDDIKTMVSFMYKTAVSPHLASDIEGSPVDMKKILSDYKLICEKYDYMVVEGSGGIVCPIRYDEQKIMLEDVIKSLGLSVIIVSDAKLGSINSLVLTASYIKSKKIDIKGVIINRYEDNIMENDNIKMMQELANVKILGIVKDGQLQIDDENIKEIFY